MTAHGVILVLNAGSSSVKFEVFAVAGAQPETLISGQVEGLGEAAHLVAHSANGALVAERRWSAGAELDNHGVALAAIMASLAGPLGGRTVLAVGHRVVHGGPDLAAPVMVDAAMLNRLRRLSSLAPLHNPHNIAGIEAAAAQFPGAPQVACFDTAFHRAHPWVADTFGLPSEFHARGVRRYGFHGLSYEYIMTRLRQEAPALAAGRLVVAHLGNGASLCAIQAGRSMDSTMGFTPLDGAPMGTRCGQLDPGVVLHLLGAEGMSVATVEALLYRNAGLRGMSGLSHDVRILAASDRPEAAAALEYFCYRVRREIGALAAVLGGVDALVFTGGIGENAAAVRAEICRGLEFLGLGLDPARNAVHAPDLSPPGARARTLVRRTHEEAMIARHTLALLGAG